MPLPFGLVSRRAPSLMLAASLATLAAFTAACSSSSTAPDVTPPATSSIVVDDGTTAAYVALGDSARIVSATDAWDLSFLTTTVALNPGVTASCLCSNEAATGDAVMAMTADNQSATFEHVSAVDASSAAFTGDVFTAHPWYRYNITGDDHQIWPVFNVYLVKHGSVVYKVQIINYYSATGEPRHISVRYARIQS